jgi:hypothetical protein
VWPVLLSMAIGAWLLRTSRFEADDPLSAALRASMAIPGVVLLLPVATMLFTAFGAASAGGVGAVTALVFALSTPAILSASKPARRFVPAGAAAAAAIALVAAAHLSAKFDADYPRPDTLVFAVDQDHQKSYWVSLDTETDAWTAGVLAGAKRGAFPLPFPLRAGRTLAVEAPAVSEPGPDIVWGEDHRAADETRSVRLRVVPPPPAEVLAISVEPPLLAARVQGKAVPLGPDGGLVLSYSAPPEAGVELVLETRGRAPITVRAIAQRAGFPREVGASLHPRPAGMMPRSGGTSSAWDELLESDMTLVARTFSR